MSTCRAIQAARSAQDRRCADCFPHSKRRSKCSSPYAAHHIRALKHTDPPRRVKQGPAAPRPAARAAQMDVLRAACTPSQALALRAHRAWRAQVPSRLSTVCCTEGSQRRGEAS